MKKQLILLALLTWGIHAERIYATFDVQPEQRAHLAFSAGGTIDQVTTDVAMVVKKGDTLATLNNADLTAKLHIAQIAMRHAKADYERQLSIKEVVQKSKLDLYQFQYDNANAQIAYIQSLLDKTILKAPFDGIISSKMIEVGDVVSGMAPRTAFGLQSEHKRKLILSFDQKYWRRVQTGNAFEYHIDGDSHLYHGVITKIYPQANAKNRKMVAEVYANDLIVGLFGTGYITAEDEESK
jgi:RND family efflux transporter MFP subunit